MSNSKILKTTLNMKEASEYLGVSYWLVTQLVRKKKLPFSKIGSKVLFRKDALDYFLSKQEEDSIV